MNGVGIEVLIVVIMGSVEIRQQVNVAIVSLVQSHLGLVLAIGESLAATFIDEGFKVRRGKLLGRGAFDLAHNLVEHFMHGMNSQRSSRREELEIVLDSIGGDLRIGDGAGEGRIGIVLVLEKNG